MRASKRNRNFVEGSDQATESVRPAIVYHHTSSLRTNLIWMSGLIKLEGQSAGAYHPQLGEIKTDAKLRRALRDFPALAWFTKRIDVPRVLVKAKFLGQKPNGEIVDFGKMLARENREAVTNGTALNRLALGFPTDSIPVVPWPQHHGYKTREGQELNSTARDAGDSPHDWWVSEVPVDVMNITEVWISSSIFNPKLVRNDWYLSEIKRMVTLCRTHEGAYIPPSWMSEANQRLLAERLKLRVSE